MCQGLVSATNRILCIWSYVFYISTESPHPPRPPLASQVATRQASNKQFPGRSCFQSKRWLKKHMAKHYYLTYICLPIIVANSSLLSAAALFYFFPQLSNATRSANLTPVLGVKHCRHGPNTGFFVCWYAITHLCTHLPSVPVFEEHMDRNPPLAVFFYRNV